MSEGVNFRLSFPLILLGLSVWQYFEFRAGQVTLKATSALEILKKAQSIEKVNPKNYKVISEDCEKDRKGLLEALQMEAYKRKQLDEQLNNLNKVLHDMAMTPIRNLR